MPDKKTSEETKTNAHEVWALKKQLLALMAQYPMPVQEVALADAVAMQIANKRSANENNVTTAQVQSRAMERHIEQVLRLISVNSDILRKAWAMKNKVN